METRPCMVRASCGSPNCGFSIQIDQPTSSKLVSSKKSCFTPRTSVGRQTGVHQAEISDSDAGSDHETSSEASSTECDDSEEKLEELQRSGKFPPQWVTDTFEPPNTKCTPEESFLFRFDYLHELFRRYWPQSLLEKIVEFTTLKAHTTNTNSTFTLTKNEVQVFMGVVKLMSLIRLGRTKRSWSPKTRIPVIAESITRSRFYKLFFDNCFSSPQLIF